MHILTNINGCSQKLLYLYQIITDKFDITSFAYTSILHFVESLPGSIQLEIRKTKEWHQCFFIRCARIRLQSSKSGVHIDRHL